MPRLALPQRCRRRRRWLGAAAPAERGAPRAAASRRCQAPHCKAQAQKRRGAGHCTVAHWWHDASKHTCATGALAGTQWHGHPPAGRQLALYHSLEAAQALPQLVRHSAHLQRGIHVHTHALCCTTTQQEQVPLPLVYPASQPSCRGWLRRQQQLRSRDISECTTMPAMAGSMCVGHHKPTCCRCSASSATWVRWCASRPDAKLESTLSTCLQKLWSASAASEWEHSPE